MSVDTVIDIARETLTLIIKCSAPMLLTSLIVGLVISIYIHSGADFDVCAKAFTDLFGYHIDRRLDYDRAGRVYDRAVP